MHRSMFRMTALLSLLTLPACASIVEGSSQTVNVDTNPRIQGTCALQNERGIWNISGIPSSVEIKRSKTDLRVRCEGMGMKGISTVESKLESWGLGNVLAGGPIGAGVDAGTGALFSYPENIMVPMMADSAAVGAQAPLAPMMQQGFMPAPVAPFGTMPQAPIAPQGYAPQGYAPQGYQPQTQGGMQPPPGLPQLPPVRAGSPIPLPMPPQGYAPMAPQAAPSNMPTSMQPGYPKQ